jgi:hypothetical protein
MEKETKPQKPQTPTTSEKLFEAFMQYYSPALHPDQADEMKSTTELIEEMEGIDEILPWEINKLMEENGFKLHYTGSGYVWLLKIK